MVANGSFSESRTCSSPHYLLVLSVWQGWHEFSHSKCFTNNSLPRRSRVSTISYKTHSDNFSNISALWSEGKNTSLIKPYENIMNGLEVASVFLHEIEGAVNLQYLVHAKPRVPIETHCDFLWVTERQEREGITSLDVGSQGQIWEPRINPGAPTASLA